MTTVELPTAKYDSINVPALMNWVLELESGNTQQGHNRLHIIENGEDYMCCLGVVSRQLAEPLELEVRKDNWSDGITRVFYQDKSGFPPKRVLAHLGIPDTHLEDRETGWTVLVALDESAAEKLTNSMVAHFSEGELVSVHTLNDSGFSFVEIAALLRKEFLEA